MRGGKAKTKSTFTDTTKSSSLISKITENKDSKGVLMSSETFSHNKKREVYGEMERKDDVTHVRKRAREETLKEEALVADINSFFE